MADYLGEAGLKGLEVAMATVKIEYFRRRAWILELNHQSIVERGCNSVQ